MVSRFLPLPHTLVTPLTEALCSFGISRSSLHAGGLLWSVLGRSAIHQLKTTGLQATCVLVRFRRDPISRSVVRKNVVTGHWFLVQNFGCLCCQSCNSGTARKGELWLLKHVTVERTSARCHLAALDPTLVLRCLDLRLSRNVFSV